MKFGMSDMSADTFWEFAFCVTYMGTNDMPVVAIIEISALMDK